MQTQAQAFSLADVDNLYLPLNHFILKDAIYSSNMCAECGEDPKFLFMCYNCKDCTDCIGCVNLKPGSHYFIGNVQYSERAYYIFLQDLLGGIYEDNYVYHEEGKHAYVFGCNNCYRCHHCLNTDGLHNAGYVINGISYADDANKEKIFTRALGANIVQK